jgi:hypothetical protein
MIPDERPVDLATGSMFDHETVYFGKRRQVHLVCPSRGTAELVAHLADLGVSGVQVLPIDDSAAKELLERIEDRHESASSRLRELVESRTADLDTQNEVFNVLVRWFVLGKPQASS